MKKRRTLTIMLFLGLALVSGWLAVRPSLAQAADTSVADSLYGNGRYAEAAQAYEQIITAGAADSALYYNLGNAYFRQGDVGRAILNYQRAAQLNPRDADIQANLALARAQATDQFAPESGSPLDTFANATRNVVTLNEMALLALGAWLLFGVLWFLYYQNRHGRGRKPLQIALFGVGVMVFLTAGAMGSRMWLEGKNGRIPAVVVAAIAPVSAEPNANTITEFSLHSGAEVEIREQRGEWVRLALPGGQVQGWIPATAVESVQLPIE
jgi:hypothetical protein